MLLQLAFETLKKRDGVGGGARKPRYDFVVVQAAGFPRRVFHHVIAHGHLAIGDKHRFIVFAHAQHRSAVYLRALLAIWHPIIIPQAAEYLVSGPPRFGKAGPFVPPSAL